MKLPPRKRTATRAPQGGWLDRIGTGAAVAFSDADEDQTPEVHVTPRMLEIGRYMLEHWAATADADWLDPRDIARETSVPLGTVQPMVLRFQTGRWVESTTQFGARRFRLTEFGARGLCDRLGVSYAEPQPPKSQPAAQRTPPQRTPPPKVSSDALRATIQRVRGPQHFSEAPPGKRGWTLAELGQIDPATAAAVKRVLDQSRRSGG